MTGSFGEHDSKRSVLHDDLPVSYTDLPVIVAVSEAPSKTSTPPSMPPKGPLILSSGTQRSLLLGKLARLLEDHADELAALEALGNCAVTLRECILIWRKTFSWARTNITASIEYTLLRSLGRQDQRPGTRGTGNTIVLKPSGFIPLTALRVAYIIDEVGFPPGVVNILVGYGNTVGNAITHHMKIESVAFTGSIVGRNILEVSTKSNLKNVTLELGEKSPDTIFDDADLEQAVNWAAFGIFFVVPTCTPARSSSNDVIRSWNHGQTCCAGSRIFVQEGIYDEFLKRFIEKARSIKVGDPFNPENFQGPQVSEIQFNRIMGYIQSGKDDGAKIEVGGERKGTEGYFIQPTISTNFPDMEIVREEIFGPVGVVIKFKDEEDVIRQANDTLYGLAAAVFTQYLNRATKTAH
ncbi:Aldehyde/histidinol dehydrogenase [Boletus coccyginus]|nr:Aldehyde/histidinol dehydrogenase [Boletus coccyginus]